MEDFARDGLSLRPRNTLNRGRFVVAKSRHARIDVAEACLALSLVMTAVAYPSSLGVGWSSLKVLAIELSILIIGKGSVTTCLQVAVWDHLRRLKVV